MADSKMLTSRGYVCNTELLCNSSFGMFLNGKKILYGEINKLLEIYWRPFPAEVRMKEGNSGTCCG